jgi:hypothetical protein
MWWVKRVMQYVYYVSESDDEQEAYALHLYVSKNDE